jgi:hypothetical protein
MQEISDETLNTLATQIADKVCYRIGDALVKVSVAGLIVSIGLMVVGHTVTKVQRRKGCPFLPAH